MFKMPNCPKCNSEYTYEDGFLYVCPECAYEWSKETEDLKTEKENVSEDENIIRDSNGNELNDGDDVIVIKDLKVKGSSSSVKIGTKVRNIKLIHNASDGHDINCRIDGFGSMKLKSEFVKKT